MTDGTADTRSSRHPVQDRPRTVRQQAVFDCLSESSRFQTAQEIHDALRVRAVSVGLTTVYRVLHEFASSGLVDVLVADSGEACYRVCTAVASHYHLVCRRCRWSLEEGDNPLVSRWARAVASAHGFVDLAPPVMRTYGICAGCAGRASAPQVP